MVTRDCAAARSRRGRVSDNRAALVGVIRHDNVAWTGETANRLEFKGAYVGAIAGRCIEFQGGRFSLKRCFRQLANESIVNARRERPALTNTTGL